MRQRALELLFGLLEHQERTAQFGAQNLPVPSLGLDILNAGQVGGEGLPGLFEIVEFLPQFKEFPLDRGDRGGEPLRDLHLAVNEVFLAPVQLFLLILLAFQLLALMLEHFQLLLRLPQFAVEILARASSRPVGTHFQLGFLQIQALGVFGSSRHTVSQVRERKDPSKIANVINTG